MAVKTFELVSYEKSNRIAWITINNESRMNALSTGVNNGLYDAFEEVDHDDDVLVAVLTGAGGRAFCAGADLKEMTERDQSTGVGAGPRAGRAAWTGRRIPLSPSLPPSTGSRWPAGCSCRPAATSGSPPRSPRSGCRSRCAA